MQSAFALPTVDRARLVQWAPILIGLLVLYVPTIVGLARGIWQSDDQAHGPIILLVSLYFLWQQRAAIFTAPAEKNETTRPLLGWPLLVFGLLIYALGRSQEILIFEIGSQIPVLFGVLLITGGMAVARKAWFPILFLVFMVPLPGFLVDAVTGSLKQHVSILAESILYTVGYPIGRSGVTLTIGPYQLLVADACSGLHSMFSLSALGLLYIYLMQHPSWLRNGILLAAILPIAFIANVVRVMVLVLVTYHFGDEAGQGFVHGAAGIVLFMVALLLLFGLDNVLGLFLKSGPGGKQDVPV